MVLSDDKITHDLFVKRGSKYSDRGTPHAMTVVTGNINPALMPKNGAYCANMRWKRMADVAGQMFGAMNAS